VVAKRIIANSTIATDASLSLVIVSCDFLNVAMYVVKFFCGLLYCKILIKQPKKEYDYIHRGKIGHLQWRIQRVKLYRKKFSDYFSASAVAVCFGVM